MEKILGVGVVALFLIMVIIPGSNAVEIPQNNHEDSDISSLNALVSRGSGDPVYWPKFSGNAQKWFAKWCDKIQSGAFDNNSISYTIKIYNVSFFYIIAHSHGESTHFQTNEGYYYTADQLRNDMKNRSPIKLALICCCEGMTYTGPGSLSYEFRKGQLNDTVTIGYTNMQEYKDSNGSMWNALDWQNHLLYYIDRGLTIKGAFDLACHYHPELANYVKFVGDLKLKINNSIPVSKQLTKTYNQLRNLDKPILSAIYRFFEKFQRLEKLLLISPKLS
jgi:hypothetical protein